MNFKEWYEEADMPTQVNGVWVDLEDGLAFNDFSHSFNLKGSFKQRIWANNIIEKLTIDLDLIKGKFKEAKFWIDNRNLSKHEILELIAVDSQEKKDKSSLKRVLNKRIKEIQVKDWKEVSEEEKKELYASLKQVRDL